MPIREKIRQMNPFAHQRAHPEVVAYEIVADVWTTMAQLMQEQGHLFAELGQTRQERQDITILVAASLYRSGLLHHSAKRLQLLLHEDELQDLICDYLCLRPRLMVEHHLSSCLMKRAAYASYVRRDTIQQQSSPDSTSGEGNTTRHSLSSVSPDECDHSHGRRTTRIGASRDLRRTGRCDPRTVSAFRVPARVYGRHTSTDSSVTTTVEQPRSSRTFHSIKLVPLS